MSRFISNPTMTLILWKTALKFWIFIIIPSTAKIDIAVLSTSSSWGQLYTNEDVPYRDHFTHRDIMDSIDIMRWSYLGFEPDFIIEKIKQSEALLASLPIMNIRILEKQ